MKNQDDERSEQAYRFINELTGATQVYGLSSAEVWAGVEVLASKLGWNARFIATPNHVQSVLWQDDETNQRIHIITKRSGNYDLDKLARIRDLTVQMESGSVLPGEGLKRLREIQRSPAAYAPYTNALAFMLCGWAFAVILRASWLDVLLGGLLGLVSYGISISADRSRGTASLMELLAAMVSAILAGGIAMYLPGFNPLAVTACALIVFVPGFGLTIAPYELILGNTLSGLVWLTNASITLLKLLGGAIIGFAIVERVWSVRQPEPGTGVAQWWSWIFAPLLVVGLAVLFRVPKKHLVWTIIGAWVTWCGVIAGSPAGYWLGTFLGAILLFLFGNLCYRMRYSSIPAIVLPGIMLLVPGYSTLRALYIGQTQGVAAGLQAGSRILVLIASILGGVLVGTAMLTSIKESYQASATRLNRLKNRFREMPRGSGSSGKASR